MNNPDFILDPRQPHSPVDYDIHQLWRQVEGKWLCLGFNSFDAGGKAELLRSLFGILRSKWFILDVSGMSGNKQARMSQCLQSQSRAWSSLQVEYDCTEESFQRVIECYLLFGDYEYWQFMFSNSDVRVPTRNGISPSGTDCLLDHLDIFDHYFEINLDYGCFTLMSKVESMYDDLITYSRVELSKWDRRGK